MAKADSDELVNEIEQIRERLADTVDALIDRTNPKTITGCAIDGVERIEGGAA